MLADIRSIEPLGRYMMQKIGDLPQECCVVFGVNTQMRVLCEVTVALGTLDGVNVHPRDIFRPLVAVNAYGFVIVHNHPSGSLNLSPADERFVKRLRWCSTVMQYHFLDFVVVTRKEYRSLRSEHLLTGDSLENLADL